jgi:hypothetical protein
MRRLAPVLITGLALLAACGDDSNGGSSPAGPIEHPTGADELVIQVQTGGGFVAPSSLALEIPAISVYGDGTFIVPGPTTLQYPGNALPNLQRGRITEAELQELLEAAVAAGILREEPPDFGDPGVTDMPSTDIIVNGDSEYHVSIYALDYMDGDDNLESEQRAARERVRDFIAMLPTDATEQYDPDAVAVLVRPYTNVESVAEPGRHDWPLGDLATTGEPIEGFGNDTRCLVVADTDETHTVLAAATNARLGDVWQSAGADYALSFRPLLPDESGCEDLHAGFGGA